MLVTTSPMVKTYTLDEFWELPEPRDRYKLELIRGVLFMVPPPDEKVHDPVVSCLNRLIEKELVRLGEPGRIFVPRSGIWTYYPDTWLEPDLFYLSAESMARFKERPRTSADLVIEVLSPRSVDHDRRTKADSYAALEVKELWLVDPETRTIEVRHNEGKKWKEMYRYGEGEILSCHAIPGLTIAVEAIFVELPGTGS